jgi:flagellar assembly protein FliH
MSGLIKSGTTHKVRPFLDAAVLPPAPARDPRLEALEREIGELRDALAEQRTASEKAVTAARAEGERQGRAAAGEGLDKRLALLGKGIETAASEWQTRLNDLDRLAPALARAALGKLFDGQDDYSHFVSGLIARQLRLLRRESVVAIRVSAHDFEDEQALAGLAAEAGTGSVRIVTDADLEAGECRFDLQLGHVDVGAKTQWAQLAAFLDELAAPESGE